MQQLFLHVRKHGETLFAQDRLRDRLAMEFFETRLVIVHFQLRRPAGVKNVDHTVCTRRKMRFRIGLNRRPLQRTKSTRSDSGGGAAEEVTSSQQGAPIGAPLRDIDGWARRPETRFRNVIGQFLVTVSSRFSNTLATAVQAAISTGSSDVSTGDSPTFSRDSTLAGSRANRARCRSYSRSNG